MKQNNPSASMVTLRVDGKSIQALESSSLLSACLSAGIYIPHICWLETFSPGSASAACRLCFVEIHGLKEPVTACTQPVENGMIVKTDTPSVRHLQITALKLLLSVHRVACKKCSANSSCALQDIAQFLGVGLSCKPFEKRLKDIEIDDRHPLFDYHVNRCVLCGICIEVCDQLNSGGFLSFAGRGFDTVAGYFDKNDLIADHCNACRACIDACPTGALADRLNDSDAKKAFAI